MNQKLNLDVVQIVFGFLQPKPGPISKDALSLASTCRGFWQCAVRTRRFEARTRTLYAVIIDYSRELFPNEPIYTRPATGFNFDGIAECWRNKPLQAFEEYEKCLAYAKAGRKPDRFLIFELKLPLQAVKKTVEKGVYELEPEFIQGSNIPRVKLISNPARPIFLNHEQGYDIEVDRSKVLYPNDFDNKAFCEPKIALKNIDKVEVQGLSL